VVGSFSQLTLRWSTEGRWDGRGRLHAWERTEIHKNFGAGSQTRRSHSEEI